MKIQNLINESVSIDVDDHNADDNFEHVGAIGYYLANLFFEFAKNNKKFFYKHLTDLAQSHKRIRFDSDGDDYFKKTGTINFYIDGHINQKFIPDLQDCLHACINKLNDHVTVGTLKYEGKKESHDSPRSSYTGDANNLSVIRIPIIKNDIETERKPSMNISNDNARNLFKVLGLNDDELVGQIPYSELSKLSMRIRNLRDGDKNAMQRQAYSGTNIKDSGVDADRVTYYLDNMLSIIDYALKHKKGIIYS